MWITITPISSTIDTLDYIPQLFELSLHYQSEPKFIMSKTLIFRHQQTMYAQR